jgi:ankyrin repeat protein
VTTARATTAPQHHFPSTHGGNRARRVTGFGLLILTGTVLIIDYRLLRQAQRNEALAVAVSSNEVKAVQRLLRQGADPNIYLVYENVTSHPARLIDWMAGTRSITWRSTPVLAIAASNGNTQVVETLLDRGADIDGADQQGWTSLMAATAAGKTDVVRVLLRRKVAVNTKNSFGNTALKVAIMNYRNESIRLLRQAGARN